MIPINNLSDRVNLLTGLPHFIFVFDHFLKWHKRVRVNTPLGHVNGQPTSVNHTEIFIVGVLKQVGQLLQISLFATVNVVNDLVLEGVVGTEEVLQVVLLNYLCFPFQV